jgi:hypothetical protein
MTLARADSRVGRLLASRGPSGGGGPLSTLWRAVQELDHSARARLGSLARERGQLAELSEAVGLREITSASLTIRLSCLAPNGGELFTLPVGPAGDHA